MEYSERCSTVTLQRGSAGRAPSGVQEQSPWSGVEEGAKQTFIYELWDSVVVKSQRTLGQSGEYWIVQHIEIQCCCIGLLQVYLSDQIHVLVCCFLQLIAKSTLHFNYFSKNVFCIFYFALVSQRNWEKYLNYFFKTKYLYFVLEILLKSNWSNSEHLCAALAINISN